MTSISSSTSGSSVVVLESTNSSPPTVIRTTLKTEESKQSSTSIIINTDIETSTTRTTTHHADLGIPRSESLLPPGTIHDEVEIEDFQFNPETGIFTYPCPCGDLFQITVEELKRGETLAKCPSCSLVVKVVYDPDDFDFNSDKEEEEDEEED